MSWDLIDGFHAQLGVIVNVYLAADSLGKRGETHLVLKLRTKACVSEPFPAPLCPPLRASVHHVGAICRTAYVSLCCYKGSESLWTSPKHPGDPCRELEKAPFRKCARVFSAEVTPPCGAGSSSMGTTGKLQELKLKSWKQPEPESHPPTFLLMALCTYSWCSGTAMCQWQTSTASGYLWYFLLFGECYKLAHNTNLTLVRFSRWWHLQAAAWLVLTSLCLYPRGTPEQAQQKLILEAALSEYEDILAVSA